MPATQERVREVFEYFLNNGEAATLWRYNINADTLERYKRQYQAEHGKAEGVERGLVFFDAHRMHTDPPDPSWLLFKRFAKDFAPDFMINGGDFADLNYLSVHDKDKLKKIEGKRIRADYDMMNKEYDELQEICDNHTYLEGNHEDRINRWVDAVPALEGMVEIPENLSTDSRGITWVPIGEQPFKIGKLNVMHGVYYGKHAAAQHLDKYSHNIMHGHTHRAQRFSKNLVIHDENIAAWSIGCLSSLNPEYLRGRPSDWQQQFAVLYVDRSCGNFQAVPVDIVNNSILWDGRKYY